MVHYDDSQSTAIVNLQSNNSCKYHPWEHLESHYVLKLSSDHCYSVFN